METYNFDQVCQEKFTRYLDKNPRYPDDRVASHVIRFLSTASRDGKKLAGIDIGCGIGRHLNLLEELGVEAWGIDYADGVCDAVIQNFPNLARNRIIQGDYRSINLQLKFDIAIAWGVVFLCRKTEIVNNLQSIQGLLKHRGQLIVNFRTLDNYFYGMGLPIERDTFLISNEGGNYSDLLYSFCSDSEAEEMIMKSGFKVLCKERLDLVEYSEDKEKKHSWLIFRLEKE